MQVYNRTIATNGLVYPQMPGIDPAAVLYLDIETTGLSAQRDRIYLVGCGYWQDGCWQLIQWFDETGEGESDILTSFLLFAKKYKVCIHYNGERFDLPFLRQRIMSDQLAELLGGLKILDALQSLDLLKVVRPFKALLGLENLRQQTLESFMGTGRTENTSGADLIKVYKAYVSLKKAGPHAMVGAASQAADGYAANIAAMEQVLIGHNASDVRGLLFITPVVELPDTINENPVVFKAQANHYKGFDGTQQEEIVLFGRLENNRFPRPISAGRDGCFLHLEKGTLTLKIPLLHGELKFFYANYQDYYYLPMEDMALHKSIAAFVDKAHRVQATAATCYTRKAGDFLPEWEQFRTPFFKKDYKDKYAWFEFRPEMKKDKQFFCEYAAYVYRHITGVHRQ